MAVKRYIACQPGQRQAVVAAFGEGFDVEIDDTLDKPYEFRERELTAFEEIEAELEQAETFQADPKGADTYVVPFATVTSFSDDPWDSSLPVAVIRAEKGRQATVIATINKLVPDYETPSATVSLIKSSLEELEVQVFSVSLARGFVPFMEET